MKGIFFVAFMLCLLGCSGLQIQDDPSEYDAWVTSCKSIQNVEDWFVLNFTYDKVLLSQRLSASSWVPIQSPAETFNRKKGVCSDASVLVKYALNKMNPNYKAEILFLDEPVGHVDHYVCVFTMNGKLYVADYGRVAGKNTSGPWDNLEDFVSWYRISRNKKVERYHYGWPAGSKRYY